MNFSPPPRRKLDDNLLPMINVVFLLLIFFLISARLTAPEPFAVTAPKVSSADLARAEGQGEFTVYVSADGTLGYRDARDDRVLGTLGAVLTDHCAANPCQDSPARLTLRADAGLAGSALAALLPRLTALGFGTVDLIVGPGGGI